MSNIIELAYNAKIKKDGDGFLVTFRDTKNAFTYGSSYEEAIFNAQEVLGLMLLDRLEKNEKIPLPSPARKGEISVPASPDVAAPVLLHLFCACKTIARWLTLQKRWAFLIKAISGLNLEKILR